MKVVSVSLSPPVGPSWAPTTVTRSQANGTRRDESRGRRRSCWASPAPDGARVPRVLPRGANRASGHHLWIVFLKRVGAEEVGGDLLIIVVEQGGLRREEYKATPEAEQAEGRQM